MTKIKEEEMTNDKFIKRMRIVLIVWCCILTIQVLIPPYRAIDIVTYISCMLCTGLSFWILTKG